ncbi:hypothetical protein HK097_005550 [Rhizophlyctis rosea]|uniref:PDZ domain-containing protein n=1 Tax=Rhizophlyctis rosea TaxID=64517 RepID=A0AAD5X621_9FUNG|nr:hypothetical protein HK097_005550 [Rhizophlyctis rosea]
MNPNLRPGDWVCAVGSPFGLSNTVTAGVISSQNRKYTDIGGRESRVEYIQTDCVVHSGSSGGPLINLDGEVIGINTTRAEKEGITFAIRVDKAIELIEQLRHKGKIVRPWLGMQMITLTPHVWEQLQSSQSYENIPQLDSGVLISSLVPDSPASKAGILEGDVITCVQNNPVRNTQEILKVMGFKVGKPVKFRIHRSIPLEIDWDGRAHRFEHQVLELAITPEELDVHQHEQGGAA